MVDPIIVGELNFDDEQLTDKENPILPTDSSWLDVEVLDVGAVMELPILTYENSLHIEPRSLPPHLDFNSLIVIFFNSIPMNILYWRKEV